MTLYGSPVSSPKGRRPYVTVLATALAVLACAGAIAAAANGASGANPPPIRTMVVPSVQVAPPVPAHAPARQRLSIWAHGGGSGYLARISDDIGAEGSAAGREDFPGTRAACQHLMRDVAEAKAYGPIPVVSLQRPWATALGHFAMAAEDCVGGIDNRDAGQLGAAEDELTVGAVEAGPVTTAILSH